MLHMLRAQVGERAFFDGVRAYYAKYRHVTAVTDDLRAEWNVHRGQSLGWFFDQWLRRPGFPEITATWSYDGSSHEVVVGMTQSARFGAFQVAVTVDAIDSTGVSHRAIVRMPPTSGATNSHSVADRSGRCDRGSRRRIAGRTQGGAE